MSRPIVWTLSALLFLARTVSAHGDLHLRIRALDVRIRKEPANAALILQRGDLHRLHRAWSKASADFDRVASLDPKLSLVWFHRAQLDFDRLQLDDALLQLARFRQEAPGHVGGLLLEVEIHFRQQHRKKGLKLLEEAEARARPRPDLFLTHARLLHESGRSVEALAVLERGLRRCHGALTLELLAVDIEVAVKRSDAALLRIDRLRERSQRKDPWWERRARILFDAGRHDEARASCRAAKAAIQRLPLRLRNAAATRTRLMELDALLTKMEDAR